jgi:hypothetical protein
MWHLSGKPWALIVGTLTHDTGVEVNGCISLHELLLGCQQHRRPLSWAGGLTPLCSVLHHSGGAAGEI